MLHTYFYSVFISKVVFLQELADFHLVVPPMDIKQTPLDNMVCYLYNIWVSFDPNCNPEWTHGFMCIFLIGNDGQRYGAKPYNPKALGKYGED